MIRVRRVGHNYVDDGLGNYELGEWDLGDDLLLEARAVAVRSPGVETDLVAQGVLAELTGGVRTFRYHDDLKIEKV